MRNRLLDCPDEAYVLCIVFVPLDADTSQPVADSSTPNDGELKKPKRGCRACLQVWHIGSKQLSYNSMREKQTAADAAAAAKARDAEEAENNAAAESSGT